MNFFRLRILNTFLLFLIGIVAGFILKDRFYPAAPAARSYSPSYKTAEDAPGPADSESMQDEEVPVSEEEEAPTRSPARAASPAIADEPGESRIQENSDSHIVIEPAAPPAVKRGDALRVSRDEFFKNPAGYSGRELEMDLQIITAKRSSQGWRLNFVYTSPDKRVDYLYAEADTDLLGAKPDLRIGYVYTVRFLCEKGETGSGNVLSAVSPTGDKADWATGLSALE